jgi:hypothetical protein
MWNTTRAAFAVVFLASLATALAHGDDEMDMNMDMEMGMHPSATTATATATPSASGANDPMSYFAYGKHSSSIIAHIALMVLGWCFVLPAGKHSIPD